MQTIAVQFTDHQAMMHDLQNPGAITRPQNGKFRFVNIS